MPLRILEFLVRNGILSFLEYDLIYYGKMWTPEFIGVLVGFTHPTKVSNDLLVWLATLVPVFVIFHRQL
jgi:hypothetical protein